MLAFILLSPGSLKCDECLPGTYSERGHSACTVELYHEKSARRHDFTGTMVIATVIALFFLKCMFC